MKSNIRQLRKDRHLSQRQLGEEVGLSQQVISRMERNREKLQIDVLLRIADFFGVSTDYVLGYEKVSPAMGNLREAMKQQSAALGEIQADYQAFKNMDEDQKLRLYYHLMEIKAMI